MDTNPPQRNLQVTSNQPPTTTTIPLRRLPATEERRPTLSLSKKGNQNIARQRPSLERANAQNIDVSSEETEMNIETKKRKREVEEKQKQKEKEKIKKRKKQEEPTTQEDPDFPNVRIAQGVPRTSRPRTGTVLQNFTITRVPEEQEINLDEYLREEQAERDEMMNDALFQEETGMTRSPEISRSRPILSTNTILTQRRPSVGFTETPLVVRPITESPPIVIQPTAEQRFRPITISKTGQTYRLTTQPNVATNVVPPRINPPTNPPPNQLLSDQEFNQILSQMQQQPPTPTRPTPLPPTSTRSQLQPPAPTRPNPQPPRPILTNARTILNPPQNPSVNSSGFTRIMTNISTEPFSLRNVNPPPTTPIYNPEKDESLNRQREQQKDKEETRLLFEESARTTSTADDQWLSESRPRRRPILTEDSEEIERMDLEELIEAQDEIAQRLNQSQGQVQNETTNASTRIPYLAFYWTNK
jgi:hypothetical protein